MLSHTWLLCKGTGLFLEGKQPLTPLRGVWPSCAGSVTRETENIWITGYASSSHRMMRDRLVKATACLCCRLMYLFLKLRSWRVRRGQSEVRLCRRAGEIPPMLCNVDIRRPGSHYCATHAIAQCIKKRRTKRPNNNEKSGASGGDLWQVVVGAREEQEEDKWWHFQKDGVRWKTQWPVNQRSGKPVLLRVVFVIPRPWWPRHLCPPIYPHSATFDQPNVRCLAWTPPPPHHHHPPPSSQWHPCWRWSPRSVAFAGAALISGTQAWTKGQERWSVIIVRATADWGGARKIKILKHGGFCLVVMGTLRHLFHHHSWDLGPFKSGSFRTLDSLEKINSQTGSSCFFSSFLITCQL